MGDRGEIDMSHYTVAVITDKIENLEKMLAPYDENMEVEPYIYRTKEQLINDAKERKQNAEKMKEEGKELSKYELEYINANTDEELYKTVIYEDKKYDENGNELSTYNPNSRWDWYSIGGRWRNSLLTKIDNKDVIEETSLEDIITGGKKAPEGYKWVDGARIKDLGFKKKMEYQNSYYKAIRFWETYIEGQEPQTEEEKEDIKWEIHKKEYYIERYGTKENFAKLESTFSCWALLDETGWYEKGEMGWWACNDSTKDSELLFLEKFTETLNKVENQDKYLIIVDCHI